MNQNHKTKSHVAFIMDGNRRFARKERKQTIHGHQKGFSKLAEVLAWCESLQIPGTKTYF